MTEILKDTHLKVGWVYTPASPVNFKVAHFVGAITASAGDVLDIRYQIEATNKRAWNIGVGRYICLGDRVNNVNDVGGVKLLPATVENCTPAMHHIVQTGSDLVVLENDIVDQYVKLIVYGLTTSYPTGTLSFEQGYGFLTVEVRRQ
jgi:hypothetical protein